MNAAIESHLSPRQRTGPRGTIHLTAGAALLITALAGLQADIPWLAQPFYAWVWWGYILALDGYSILKRGDSLLTTRRRFFFPICVWSITFWFFFELLNARLQNWYYVGVFPFTEFISGAIFTVFAFATVFMGIFETADALNASGMCGRWKGPRRSFPLGLTYGLQIVGLVMGGLALVFPYYLAPLIWGSFTFLVDPWNYRRGARSLLRDLEAGDYGLLARLLLAGLICGVVWESLNFFAPQKWIYTVRGLEGLKVFEMPLVGFLGFPGLALDSVAAFALGSSLFLGNRSWERPEDLSYSLRLFPMLPKRAFWTAVFLQMIFWLAVTLYATPLNIGSIQLELRDLDLAPLEEAQLRQCGISRPRQLLQACRTPPRERAFCKRLKWDPSRLEELRRRSELYTFKGIGRVHGKLLEQAGVHSPNDLKAWAPESLHARLLTTAVQNNRPMPRLDFVRGWVLAARDRSVIQNSR